MRTLRFTLLAIAGLVQLCVVPHAISQVCAPLRPCGDVDNNGAVTASDSLGVLNRAVGLPVNLTCVCEATDGASCPPLRTGETECFDAAGDPVSCAGSGQDGETQAGAARVFTNNGDGTITDEVNGLMWEKLSDDGSIHDQDDSYAWEDAVSEKIDALNSASFAGFNDWRLPNRFESETLLHLGESLPATYSAFASPCTPGCSVTACSCTASGPYWTSTNYSFDPTNAWYVGFGGGPTVAQLKSTTSSVRAVRTTP